MAKNPPHEENDEITLGEDVIPGQYQDPNADKHHLDEPNFSPTDIPADEVEIENPISQVASAPAKNLLIIGILLVVAIFFVYKTVFKESDTVKADKQLKEEIESQPVAAAKPPTKQEGAPQVNIGVVDTPDLPVIDTAPQALPPLPAAPDLPKEVPAFPPAPVVDKSKELEIPPPPKAPEQVKIEPAALPKTEPVPEIKDNTTDNMGPTPEQLEADRHAKELAKRKIGQVIINGGGKDTNGALDPSIAAKSPAISITATKVDLLGLTILQGKMIDAVLETTINTELPGSLRAVISRDIYAESGKNILIPRGSRLIGSYDNGIQQGQQRIIISWGRVIRPDGVDIDIASKGTDQLGRAGMTGIVDNKYFEIFSNALLVSAITIGSSLVLDKVHKSQTATSSATTNTDGSTTSTQSANTTDASVLQGVQSLTDSVTSMAKNGLNSNPTIIINQGARIKVFVNKDLVFPSSVVHVE